MIKFSEFRYFEIGIGIFLVLIVCYKIYRKRKEYKNYLHNIEQIKTVTSLDRGTNSERDLILKLLDFGIHPNAIFHDLYLQKGNKFSQIDLVMATKVGIIVFEVKDYSGWIFGNGFDRKWTQVLAYGRDRYTFYNPVLQNNSHINNLKRYSCFNDIQFYSIIVFDGDCELRDVDLIPDRTFVAKPYRVCEIVNNILNNNKLVQYPNKYEIVDILKQAVKNGEDEEIVNKHIDDIEDLIGKHRVYR